MIFFTEVVAQQLLAERLTAMAADGWTLVTILPGELFHPAAGAAS